MKARTPPGRAKAGHALQPRTGAGCLCREHVFRCSPAQTALSHKFVEIGVGRNVKYGYHGNQAGWRPAPSFNLPGANAQNRAPVRGWCRKKHGAEHRFDVKLSEEAQH